MPLSVGVGGGVPILYHTKKIRLHFVLAESDRVMIPEIVFLTVGFSKIPVKRVKGNTMYQ